MSASLFTTNDVRTRTGWSLLKVRTLIEQGKLKAVNTSTSARPYWNILPESLEAYLNVEQSILLSQKTSVHEILAEAVAKDLDVYRQPKPVTKQIIAILDENPDWRIMAITRQTAECVVWHLRPHSDWLHIEMRWSEEYHAWSHRPATGNYQQIIIFVPRDDE